MVRAARFGPVVAVTTGSRVAQSWSGPKRARGCSRNRGRIAAVLVHGARAWHNDVPGIVLFERMDGVALTTLALPALHRTAVMLDAPGIHPGKHFLFACEKNQGVRRSYQANILKRGTKRLISRGP